MNTSPNRLDLQLRFEAEPGRTSSSNFPIADIDTSPRSRNSLHEETLTATAARDGSLVGRQTEQQEAAYTPSRSPYLWTEGRDRLLGVHEYHAESPTSFHRSDDDSDSEALSGDVPSTKADTPMIPVKLLFESRHMSDQRVQSSLRSTSGGHPCSEVVNPQTEPNSKLIPNKSEANRVPPGLDRRSLWDIYLDQAGGEDKEMSDGWESDLDTLLIFAALFSAVLTAFVIESYQGLQEDPAGTTVVLLQAILLDLRGNSTTTFPSLMDHFEPTASAVRVNIYWSSSLLVSLSTALIAILAKQWVHSLHTGLSPVPKVRVRQRQYRLDRLYKWRLPVVLSFLPVLLHISLLLFFAGLLDFVWALNKDVAIPSFIIVFLTVFIYAAANTLPYVYPDCPYKTSVTALISVAHGISEIFLTQLMADILMARDTFRSICTSWLVRGRCSYTELLDNITDIWSSGRSMPHDLTRDQVSYHGILQNHDEGPVTKKAPLLDARALVWLITNAARLENTGELGLALVSFPDLIRFRRLFIDGGAIQLLERLLHAEHTAMSDLCQCEEETEATECIRAMSMLLTEAELGDFPSSPNGTRGLLSAREEVPYIILDRGKLPAVVPLPLPDTMHLVVDCLSNLDHLPLTFASHVLRLSLSLADAEDYILWYNLDRERVITKFHHRITTSEIEDDKVLEGELRAAVNTVIYAALQEIATFKRNKPLGDPQTTIHHWLDVLTGVMCIMCRSVIDGVTCRQICWAICALSWHLQYWSGNGVVEPILPRLQGMHNIAKHFCHLLSTVEQDTAVISAVLTTIEGVLYRCGPVSRSDQRSLYAVLAPIYAEFLTNYRIYLESGNRGGFSLPAALNTVVITKISVYLMVFDQHSSEHRHSRQPQLLRETSQLLRYVCDTREDSHVITEAFTPEHTVNLQRKVRRWAYAAACQLSMLLIDPLTVANPWPGMFDLVDISPDIIEVSMLDIVSALASNARSSELRSVFFNFSKGLFPQFDGHQALDGHAGYFEDTLTILTGLIKRGLLEHLIRMQGEAISLLRTAMDSIRSILYAGFPPADDSRLLDGRMQLRHLSFLLTQALSQTWISFLRTWLAVNPIGISRTTLITTLASIVRISAFLAFPQQPRQTSNGVIVKAVGDICVSVINERPVDVTTRRWAYGTMGSMALFYMVHFQAVIYETNSLDHLTFDKPLSEDQFSKPVLRLLSTDLVQRGLPTETHCTNCVCGESTFEIRHRNIPKDTIVAMLKVLLVLFKDEGEEAQPLRHALLSHGFSDLIIGYLFIHGEICELANSILDHVPGFPGGHVQHGISDNVPGKVLQVALTASIAEVEDGSDKAEVQERQLFSALSDT